MMTTALVSIISRVITSQQFFLYNSIIFISISIASIPVPATYIPTTRVFDDEPATVAMMDKYLEENGYVNDFTGERRHHEIYLSDPRKVAPEKCKTVIRHPIKKA